ncbi:MAG: DUF4280 domain-containing protein [Planctomycetaceae bacterium]|nr:DUF4280 domain-containing protein [Planctomycetaceae bacterium]
MPQQVVMGAMLTCSMGVAPSSLIVTPANRVNGESVPAANIMDHIPMTNILPFGMCTSPANPEVAAATAAAEGVLVPQPCEPVIPAPWAPGSPNVMVGGQPALNNTCTCECTWAGTITIDDPGQPTIQIS